MSKLYEFWEDQQKNYKNTLNSYYTYDDFLLSGKIQIRDKPIIIKSKYFINKIEKENENENSITTKKELTLTHKLHEKFSYSISQKSKNIFFNSLLNLFNTKFGQISLITNLNLINEKNNNEYEKIIFNPKFLYQFKNHTCFNLSLDEYDLKSKEKSIDNFSFYFLRGIQLNDGMIVYGGLNCGISILKKIIKYHKFSLIFKNNFFNLLFNLNLKKNKDNIKKIDKDLNLNFDMKINNKITIGGDTNLDGKNENGINTRLFCNYNISPETLIKSKWENKDKSFSFCLLHDFRGILKFGISTKINSNFQPKFGINLNIDETLF